MSIPEAAAILGKSERQVRYMIRNGELQAVKVAGRWMLELAQAPSNGCA